MLQQLFILLLGLLSQFTPLEIEGDRFFYSSEKERAELVVLGRTADDWASTYNYIDEAAANARYSRSYSRTGKYGFDMSLDDIARQYGEKGKSLVQKVEKEAEEILSKLPPKQNKMKGDPVLSGIIDTKGSGEIFFGRNLKNADEVTEFIENAHPFIKERFHLHVDKLEKGLVKAPIDDIKRAGTTYNGDKFEGFLVHSEVVALDKAIKARGGVFKEADLQDFLLHNRQLFKGKNGVPPRCVNCWHQTEGIKVIGND